MDVRNFLQLESAFQRDRIVNTTPEVKEIAMTKKLLRQFFNIRVTLKNGFDLVRNSRQLLHHRLGQCGRELATHLCEIERGERQSRQLSGERFCGGDAYFRAGMRIDRAVCLAEIG